MAVLLYNAELSPLEIRGFLIALQQLAIAFSIMVSFWIGYENNPISGTGVCYKLTLLGLYQSASSCSQRWSLGWA